ncbi:MAG: hypothetical protein RR415_07085, partial [Ruthenibacterium sp.]
ITVIQQPVAVTYTCADCGEEISIPYDEFCEKHGDNPFDDWDGKELLCPMCGSVDSVNDFEFE